MLQGKKQHKTLQGPLSDRQSNDYFLILVILSGDTEYLHKS